MKTISQLKNHYEKAHFMKDLTYLKKKLNKCGKKKYMKKKTYNSKYPQFDLYEPFSNDISPLPLL